MNKYIEVAWTDRWIFGKFVHLQCNWTEFVDEVINCSTTVGDEKGCKQHEDGSAISKSNHL